MKKRKRIKRLKARVRMLDDFNSAKINTIMDLRHQINELREEAQRANECQLRTKRHRDSKAEGMKEMAFHLVRAAIEANAVRVSFGKAGEPA